MRGWFAIATGMVVLLAVAVTTMPAASPAPAAPPGGQRSIFEEDGEVPGPTLTPPVTPAPPVGSSATSAPSEPAAPARTPRSSRQPSPRPPARERGVPTSRPAVPGEAAQHEAERLVHEVFRDEYADASDAGRQALAKQLLSQAAHAQNLAERFVLLRESADVAAAGGDLDACDHALAHIPANFDSDGLRYRLSAYQRLPARAELGDALAAACIEAADSAIAAEQLDLADEFLQLPDARQEKSSAASLRAYASAIAARRGELRTRRAAAQQLAAAEDALKKNPKDVAAMSVIGRHLCLVRGDWEQGLPLLAASDDPTFKAVAAAEVKGSASPEERLELANRWWALRERTPGSAGDAIARHAGEMYATVAPQLSGLRKTLAEKRAAEARSTSVARGAVPDGVGDPHDAAAAPARPAARRPASVTFVCDASGSMLGLPFDLMKQQLRLAVDALSPQQSFNIIMFNRGGAYPLSARQLLSADEKNKAAADAWLTEQDVAANSDPIPSLRLAFAQAPEVIYLLTDGAFENNDAVLQQIGPMNVQKRTRVHTIAFLSPDIPAADKEKCEGVLRTIAGQNGGRFRLVLTTDLARDGRRK